MKKESQADKKPLFNQKTADKSAAPISPITGLPMLRVYRIEPHIVDTDVLGVEVYVRAQYWEDQHNGQIFQDGEQKDFAAKAARLAAESGEPKTVYHTRAWPKELPPPPKKRWK